jgi:hypothetical protein
MIAAQNGQFTQVPVMAAGQLEALRAQVGQWVPFDPLITRVPANEQLGQPQEHLVGGIRDVVASTPTPAELERIFTAGAVTERTTMEALLRNTEGELRTELEALRNRGAETAEETPAQAATRNLDIPW